MKKDFILKTTQNDILRVTTYSPINKPIIASIVYVHGFKGFKDWGFVPFLANYLAENDFFIVTFNFSHNGVGESLTEFVELDKFENNTYSLEIEELNFILDALKSGLFDNNFNEKIGLIGHSRGSAISILASSQRNDINAMALWSSICRVDRFSEEQKEIWLKNGFLEVINTRTKQVLKLGLPLLKDIETNISDSLNIEKCIKKLNTPMLIAHGEEDISVPISESEELYRLSNGEKTRFLRIANANHTFNTQHPFTSSSFEFDLLLDETKQFFLEYLK